MITTPDLTPGQARDMLTDTFDVKELEPEAVRMLATVAGDFGERIGLKVSGYLVAVIVPVSDLNAVHYCENHDGGEE